MSRSAICLLIVALLLSAGISYAQDGSGAVTGPVPWNNFEGQRITLCRVVGDQRPTGIPVECVFDANLTTRLDADGNFMLNHVPSGWYLFFYEVQAEDLVQSYEEVLALWDGKTIPVGDLNFPTTIGTPDGVIVPSGCLIDQIERCIAYTIVTFYRPGSPIRLATDIGNDLAYRGITFATTQVQPDKTVQVGYGEVVEASPDADGDGVLDAADNCPLLSNADQADGDADMIGDACDVCPSEAGSMLAAGCPDGDHDGTADAQDNCPAVANNQADSDGNGIGDACQDSDGDSIIDAIDSCPAETGPSTTAGCPDGDADGLADKDDACPAQAGLPEMAGCPDSDADGIADSEDACPAEAGFTDTGGCPDSDTDSIVDDEDNCPDASNSDQADFNSDGVGDVCQDSDGDTVLDADDQCPAEAGSAAAAGCADRDGDNVPDQDDSCPEQAGSAATGGCPDADGDAIADTEDNCPEDANPDQGDFNDDNVGDACQDSDGDTLLDADDRCPAVPGVVELGGCPDSDQDTLIDTKDRCPYEAGSADFAGCPDPLLFTLADAGSRAVWNADQSRLITVSSEMITVWDMQTGQKVLELPERVRGARWSADGSRILTWQGSSFQGWDAETGAQLWDTGYFADDALWNIDESLIISWHDYRVAYISNGRTGAHLRDLNHDAQSSGPTLKDVEVAGVAWHPQDPRLLVTWLNNASEVTIWNAQTGQVVFTFDTKKVNGGARWSPDGSRVLIWLSGGSVEIWDATTGRRAVSLSSDSMTGGLSAGAIWNADGTRILSWPGIGDAIYVWDAITGTRLLTLHHRLEEQISSAGWNADESLILSKGRVWDATSGALLQDFRVTIGITSDGSAWTPDGKRLAAWNGIKDEIYIWNTQTGAQLFTLTHRDVTGVMWKPDGSQLVSWGAGTVLVWDVAGDSDGDGWRDPKDSCPTVANPDQADQDSDGMGDLCDQCPTAAGAPSAGGCPDADGDQVTDAEDQCPDQTGLIDLAGCPDADGDTVPDPDDQCPNQMGLIDLAGCPDADGDTVPDPDDDCPNIAGLVERAGCPDADGDGVLDADDKCPDQAGLTDLAGCPDGDGDGVADPDDQCPDVVGLPEINGCLFTGTVADSVNMREKPSTRAAILGQVGPGDSFVILGRNEPGDWLRIRTVPGESEQPIEAWLFAPLVTTEAEVNTLPVLPE